jgi:imidazole glycerol-phosphate synthase subunit HisF
MYKRPRIIPVLSIIEGRLVKTTQFKDPRYIGDPINALRIFNNKAVDEICILDIRASYNNKGPDMEYLTELSSEAFVPLGYGGGISNIEQIKQILAIGFEKIIINSNFDNIDLIRDAVQYAGSQSIVVSIDVKKDRQGNYIAMTHSGSKKSLLSPLDIAIKAEKLGVGEILINSVDKDGTMTGLDRELIKIISQNLSIPVVACGGTKNIEDIKETFEEGYAHAIAAGSLFVYYGKNKGILINFPEETELYNIGIYK